MRRVMALTALAALGVVGLSCRDNSGPRGGTLRVRLTSPNSGADSAMVLTIAGPAGLTSLTAGAGLGAFHQPLGGDATRVLLVGRLLDSAVVVTIAVTDPAQVSQYAATIQAIAQPNYQLRSLPGGYALAVVP